MNGCTGCKNNESWKFNEPCTICSRAYDDKWEAKPSDMTVEEAKDFLLSSYISSMLSAREREALGVLIREAEGGVK